MERQDTFNWVTAVDVFLGGAGGGVFFISFIMDLQNKYEVLARIGAICGIVLVLIGALILFADLGTKTRFYRLVINPSSWMSRGTWIIIIFAIFGLVYSLPAFWFAAWKATLLGKVIGVVAAVFSLLITLYTAFLLGAVKRVPLWNTAALPMVFFFSSLCTGIAILLLIAPFITLGDTSYTLMIVAIVAILAQSLALGVFTEITSKGTTPTNESIRLLLRDPLFIIGVIIIGLIIPFVLLLFQIRTGDAFVIPILSGIFLLIGNFVLRYRVLTAGIRLPVYPF